MPRGGRRANAGRPRGDTAGMTLRLTPADRDRARAVLNPRESLAALFREAGLAEVSRREARRKR